MSSSGGDQANRRYSQLQTASAMGDGNAAAIAELARRQIASAHGWAIDNGVSLYIGETGIPAPTTPEPEGRRWRGIGYEILAELYARGIPAFCWSARKSLRPTDILDPYKASGGFNGTLDTALASAEVFETAPSVLRGINVSDGHLGYNIAGATGGFSDVNRGTYGVDYVYHGEKDYRFLAARGYTAIRMTVRWERMQPALGAALDATEMGRIDASIDAAGRAGLKVYLCLKNHGAYYQDVAGTSTRRILGSAQLTQAHFVDLWTRLSARYKNTPAVVAYDLDNEPANPTVADWQAASQAAVTAIRGNADNKLILVEGGGPNYSGISSWVQDNGPIGWITDPANNMAYEGHLYPQGQYQLTNQFVSIETTVRTAITGVADRLKVYDRAAGTQQLDAALQSMPIPPGTTGVGVPVSGTIYTMYVDCHLDQLLTKLEGYTSVGGTGLTVARMNIGIVNNSSGDFTVLAETASDPASWQANNAFITAALSTARGGASSVRVVKGQRYTMSLVLVGTLTAAAIPGALFSLTGMGGQAPKLARRLTGQADLWTPGTTVTAASLADVNGRYYMLAKP